MALLGLYPKSHLDSKAAGIGFGRRRAWLPLSPPALFKFCGDAFAAQVSKLSFNAVPFRMNEATDFFCFHCFDKLEGVGRSSECSKCHSLGSWGQE